MLAVGARPSSGQGGVVAHPFAVPATGAATAASADAVRKKVFMARLDLMLFPAISALLLLHGVGLVVAGGGGRPLKSAGVPAHRHRLLVLAVGVAQRVVVHRWRQQGVLVQVDVAHQ